MTTVIGGSAPSITFSDSTTQSTAALPLTGGSVSADITVHGLTVGLGGASGAANTAYGVSAIPIAPNSGVVAIGNSAGKLFNTSSDTGQSTFVGYFAGASCVSGTDNTFVGGSAGTNTTGSKNTALGSQALQLNTSASNNTAVGYQSLYTNTTGAQLAAFGHTALYSTTTATATVGLGHQAGYGNTTGSNNTFVGDTAAYSNSTGSYNTAIGSNALQANTTASNNTAVGYQALYTLSTGNNTAIGYGALYGVSGGSGGSTNVGVGYNAGSNINSNASYVVCIGPNTQLNNGSDNTEIILGTNPSANVTGKGGNTFFVYANNSGTSATGGSYYNGANSSSWSTTSDGRIKENIVTIADGLTPILALRPVSFDYIVSKQKDVSFIAQEYQTVFPEQVVTHSATKEEAEVAGTDTIFGLQKNLDPYLVRAIQQLNALVTAQATEITALKAKVGI